MSGSPQAHARPRPRSPGGFDAMKKIVPFVLVTALTACGQSEAPQKAADSKANIPTVEALAANPERLKELRQQCKTDRAKLVDGRSEARRVGKEFVSTCRTRWAPDT